MDTTIENREGIAKKESGENDSSKRFLAELDKNKSSQAADSQAPQLFKSSPGFIPPVILETMSAHGDSSGRETEDRTTDLQKKEHQLSPHTSDQPNGEREVYDAKFGYANPGSRARFEGDPPTGDPDVDRVYEYTGLVRDFYRKEFGLNSIDGQGMKVVSTANYGENYQNAYWDGKQMFYGHPSEQSPFKTFAILDITGHELTHGVTQHQVPGMWQWYQAGALDEHFSDAFGAMVDQYAHNQKATDADWVLGKGAFKPGINARGVRDMLHPGTAFDDPKLGKDPQTADMKDYYTGSKDNWGVHINSGIPNKAFATFAQSVGGYSWKDPGHIWFEARKHLSKNPTFAEFAYDTIEAAKTIGTPDEVVKLKRAWDSVGVVPEAPSKQ